MKSELSVKAQINTQLEQVWAAISRPESIFGDAWNRLRVDQVAKDNKLVWQIHMPMPGEHGGGEQMVSELYVATFQTNRSITWINDSPRRARATYLCQIEPARTGVILQLDLGIEYANGFQQLMGKFIRWLSRLVRRKDEAKAYVENVAKTCSADFQILDA